MNVTPNPNTLGPTNFGTAAPPANANPINVSSQMAETLRDLQTIATALDAGNLYTTATTQDSPTLTPSSSIPLSTVINTLNIARNALTAAIFDAITSNTSLLKQMFDDYLASDPGRIVDGTATNDQTTNSGVLLDVFNKWLDVLNIKDRSFVTPSFTALMRLVPDSDTPSIAQSLEGAAASGGTSGVGIQSATQTNTGPSFYGELIKSLFTELMQKGILIQPTQGEALATDQIDQALLTFLSRAAALSNLATVALLKDANTTSQQNPDLLLAAEAGAVFATLLDLLEPGALDQASRDLSQLLGITLTPENTVIVQSTLSGFLQQTVVTSGLGILLHSLEKGLLSQEQATALKNRILATGSALRGDSLASLNFAETFQTLQNLIKSSPSKQGSLTLAASQLLTQNLQDQGLSETQATTLAGTLASSSVNFFASASTATAPGLGQVIQSSLQDTTQNPDGIALTADQQRSVVNQLLQFASTVTTQQQLQTAVIQTKGAASAAPGFASGITQLLFGSSVNTLDGTALPSSTKIGSDGSPLAPLSATQQISQIDTKVFQNALDSYSEANKTNVDYSSFVQTLLEPSGLFMKLFNPAVYGNVKPSGVVGIAPQIGEGP